MSHRHLASTLAPVIVVALLMQMPAAGQTSAKAKAASKTRTPPRTPDGQPDLQGFWTNSTLTPLERPSELAGKQVLTEQEAVEYQRRVQEQADASPPGVLGRALGALWFERGEVVAGRRRRSWRQPVHKRGICTPPTVPRIDRCRSAVCCGAAPDRP